MGHGATLELVGLLMKVWGTQKYIYMYILCISTLYWLQTTKTVTGPTRYISCLHYSWYIPVGKIPIFSFLRMLQAFLYTDYRSSFSSQYHNIGIYLLETRNGLKISSARRVRKNYFLCCQHFVSWQSSDCFQGKRELYFSVAKGGILFYHFCFLWQF